MQGTKAGGSVFGHEAQQVLRYAIRIMTRNQALDGMDFFGHVLAEHRLHVHRLDLLDIRLDLTAAFRRTCSPAQSRPVCD